MTSCGNQALFKDGAGCGACYQVLESTNVLISGGPDMLMLPCLRVSYIEKLTFFVFLV
jgi:hypothetical protein